MSNEVTQLTEEQLKKAAAILEANKEARYAFQWLWNGADTDFVRSAYFMSFLRHCEEAMNEAKK